MIPVVKLPRGVGVRERADACRVALEAFAVLEPTHFALAHWLATFYRAAIVGACEEAPFSLRMTEPVADLVGEAQALLDKLRRNAREPSRDFVADLPSRVGIARTRDERGNVGFGPLDMPGAPLDARVLSLFLADYLTRPEHYLTTAA